MAKNQTTEIFGLEELNIDDNKKKLDDLQKKLNSEIEDKNKLKDEVYSLKTENLNLKNSANTNNFVNMPKVEEPKKEYKVYINGELKEYNPILQEPPFEADGVVYNRYYFSKLNKDDRNALKVADPVLETDYVNYLNKNGYVLVSQLPDYIPPTTEEVK